MDLHSIFRYRYALLSLAVIVAAAIYFISPIQKHQKAAVHAPLKTSSQDPGLPNYDIRTDKKAYDTIAGFRMVQGKNASQVADKRDAMARGEQNLRQRIPTLKIETSPELQTPEVIAPDVKQGSAFLTSASRPAGGKHADILINFLRQNTELVGAKAEQVQNLRVAADYSNPEGELSFVELNQEINGIPVFRGEVKAGFNKNGQMARVINNLAPGLEYETLSTDFGDPANAVSAAASHISSDSSKLDMRLNEAESSAIKSIFGKGDSATVAEKMYFPTEPGVAIPAWRILIWQPTNAYYVVVDAQNGTLLWRKNLGADQTQPATYSVYVNPNAMINVAHSPFPMSPGTLSPIGTQAPAIGRTSITRIGNEPPYTFNQLGWLNDGRTTTDGNNVQAGIDRDGIDGVDPGSEAVNASRNFTYNYNPFNPNTNSGDAPVPVTQTYPGTAFQQGTVTNLFYITNWFHDETYRLGFTEAARNFQHVNFTGQGNDGDRVRAEGQDSSGVNNANFDTAADGIRGRMQMYLFTGPNPDIDGNLDADVITHELAHGLSNRLHGNASGLTLSMSNAMGEGWSDFYGLSLLSQPSDPVNGIYPTGGYDTYLFGATGVNNNYYGIRRFPYAVMSSTGPNGRPHNPLTFADIDSTKYNLSDGAFAPRSQPTPDEVHAAGEVWCSALWEIRGRMITRLGWEVGNRRALQIVTDGMKLAPLSPTFLTERDAIIAAAIAGGSQADVADVWAGFAIRGMGASASIQVAGSSGSTRVTEAFDLPNLDQSPNLTVSDSAGNNNGVADPGEVISLSIPISNNTGNTAGNVTLQIVGGGSANYGTIESGTTVTRQINFTIPADTPCGSIVTLNLNVNSSLGAVSFTRTIAVGQPNVTFSENFDSVTAPAIPSGWTAASVSGGVNFVTTTITPDSAPNAAFALDPTSVGGGTDLTSPAIPITAAASTVTFRHFFNTEPGWDGGVLEISINNGAFQDIITAGGTFLQNGYTSVIGEGTNNPLSNRNAWNGHSGGYITSIVRLPAVAAGQSVRLKWRFGADNNTVGTGSSPGWRIDNVQVAGTSSCSAGLATPPKSRADFDGDGKTDLSVFRPNDGNWFVQRSTAGLTVVNWGLSTDILTPGDFDGDGKADMAVWRPSTGIWFVIRSGNGQVSATQFGQIGDIPQPGDFDGDGKDDLVVWRPSNGIWFRTNSTNGQLVTTQYGQEGDRPVSGDFDGDGKRDIAVYRPGPGLWFIQSSATGQTSVTQFGVATDFVTPADYDGDNKDDIAVFRPSDGNWYRLNSNGGQMVVIHYGQAGDVPIPGDYDGDGKDDQAVYRGAGIWFQNASTTGSAVFQFGVPTDIPIPFKYIPPAP